MQQQKLTIVNFASRFETLISRSGFSQKEIAARLGISEGSIVNYKRDRIPKAEELLTIATYFGVTMEWLLTGDEDHTSVVQEAEAIYRISTVRDRELKAITADFEKLLVRLRSLSAL